jgi:hypothetical protein
MDALDVLAYPAAAFAAIAFFAHFATVWSASRRCRVPVLPLADYADETGLR